MISVAAGLVGLARCIVDNRLVRAASVCMRLRACVCVTECVSAYIDPPGSDSLLCCLVQFHIRVSHAAGQRLLLHCPEGMCVFDELPTCVCVCVARRGSVMIPWPAGLAFCLLHTLSRWELDVGVGRCSFQQQACLVFLSGSPTCTKTD